MMLGEEESRRNASSTQNGDAVVELRNGCNQFDLPVGHSAEGHARFLHVLHRD